MAKPDWVVLQAEPAGGYRLRLTFQDATSATVDLSDLVRLGGVFEPLRDTDFFARVRVDEEGGTVVWPNDVDLAPEELHRRALHEPVRAGATLASDDQSVSLDSDVTATRANKGGPQRTAPGAKRRPSELKRTPASTRKRAKPGL